MSDVYKGYQFFLMLFLLVWFMYVLCRVVYGCFYIKYIDVQGMEFYRLGEFVDGEDVIF